MLISPRGGRWAYIGDFTFFINFLLKAPLWGWKSKSNAFKFPTVHFMQRWVSIMHVAIEITIVFAPLQPSEKFLEMVYLVCPDVVASFKSPR